MLTAILVLGNLVLASANVTIGFSLFAYVLAHNARSPVARAFCALMAFVTVVYVADVSVADVDQAAAAGIWLRVQWVGIAMVPAAYLHFSDALLRTTGSVSRWRRLAVLLSYGMGLCALLLVATTPWVVNGVAQRGHLFHLLPGLLFWPFAVYYIATSLVGWRNIRRARARCLTTTSRRRMSYLTWAFVAPSIGVFPFLLVPTTAQQLSPNLISLITLVGNCGLALMTVVIGYAVAYQGVLLPDRVIKHRLIHFLLRGPLVAILVIVLMLTVPRVEHILGVPRETVLIVTVAGSVVILQLLVNVSKPAIDRLIYRRDRQEVAWIQTLDQRLLTTTDLEQLLENTLITLCDLLRVSSGFIVTVEGVKMAARVFCGPRDGAEAFLGQVSQHELSESLVQSRQDEIIENADFVLGDGHWLLPLHTRSDRAMLGILGIRANLPTPQFGDDDLELLYDLVRRAETALEDMLLQQQVFGVLQGLGSELDQLQEWRSIPRFSRGNGAAPLAADPLRSAAFVAAVKDALSQFWGGPKLSQSPLLRLRLVRAQLAQQDQVPAKAVRAVLQEAIERLKPSGERSMTAVEWMVYNILDLKFVQGQRIRDIAQRLAMSESDFYRKQRVAVEQVAETLIQMERSDEAKTEPEESAKKGSTS
jgi:GAF domain-containing protein